MFKEPEEFKYVRYVINKFNASMDFLSDFMRVDKVLAQLYDHEVHLKKWIYLLKFGEEDERNIF